MTAIVERRWRGTYEQRCYLFENIDDFARGLALVGFGRWWHFGGRRRLRDGLMR